MPESSRQEAKQKTADTGKFELVEKTFPLDEKLKKMAAQDNVFENIIKSLNQNWRQINNADKKLLIKLTGDLVRSLEKYCESRINLEKISDTAREFYFDSREEYLEATQNADKRERAAHNAFIANMNILSRKMGELGLNNSWRKNDKIYGLNPESEREKTREWALKVFPIITN